MAVRLAAAEHAHRPTPSSPLRAVPELRSRRRQATRLQHRMFALRLAAHGPSFACQSSSASRAASRSLCARLRGMATSGASSGGTVAPPLPAAAEQQQQPACTGGQQQQQAKVRNYPDEPRVGVGIVILRQLPPANTPEVLLIRRAKEPSKGRFQGSWTDRCKIECERWLITGSSPPPAGSCIQSPSCGAAWGSAARLRQR